MMPKLTFGVVLIILMLFLFVNADFIYGQYAEQVKTTMVFYFILLAVVLSAFGKGLPSLSLSVMEFRNFAVMFIVTSVVLAVPLKFVVGLGLGASVTTAIGFGLLHAFVKAFIEETVWADILQRRIGKIGSAVTFGMFHITASLTIGGINWIGIGALIALRYVWDSLHNRWGIGGSTGSHFAYNAFIEGFRLI